MDRSWERKEKVEGQAWQHKQEQNGTKQHNHTFYVKKKIRFVYMLAKIHFLCNVASWFTVQALKPDTIGSHLSSTANLHYNLN